MHKTIKIYLVIFIAILGAMIANDMTKKKPIDWSSSFLSSHKKPFGAYVLFKELKDYFPNSEIKKTKVSPYEFLSEYYLKYYETEDETILSNKMNYLFINSSISLGEQSCEELLYFVNEGNNVMMVGQDFPSILKDTLQLKISSDIEASPKLSLKFANKKLNRSTYIYEKGVENFFFSELDSLTTTVLGYNFTAGADKHINFVKVKYGDGSFILNTQPYAFTNFHMLKKKHAAYVGTSLSYLPGYTLVWDDRTKAQTGEIGTPLRFILSKQALKYAWYLSLFTLFIFIIFRAKRRQRVVPIINKLPNTSIAFAKTIGNLYYQEGEPKDIVSKKITYFLEHIRNVYMLDTQNLDVDFKRRLHLKTGISKEEINRLIDYIVIQQKSVTIKEYALVILNKHIENFYTKTEL